MSESTSSIYRAMSRFLSGTMLSRISGLGRDVAMAYAFGTSAQVAAFLVSIRFAHLLRRVLGEGCLQSAFIPLFEEMKRESPAKAAAFFRYLNKGLLILLTLISLLSMALLGVFLHFGDPSEGNREIFTYTLIMMPSLIFICLYGLYASLLQCEGSFFLPSASPIAFNVVWIAGTLLLSPLQPSSAMSYLSLFIIAGCFLQWAVLLPKSTQLLPEQTYYEGSTKDFTKIIKPMFLGMIGIAAVQINSALDAVFARVASSEGPAYLWYAIRIEQLPLALFGVALSGALLPPLTRAVKAQNFEKAASFYKSALSTTLAVIIPMTFALIFSGKVSVALLYQRGDFSSLSTSETTLCLWGYGLGLLPSVLVLVTAPVFFALSDYKTPSKASCYAVLINIVLNFAGVFYFNLGAFWIAAATSISAFFNAWMLNRNLKGKIDHALSPHLKTIFKATGCSILYGILALFLESFFHTFFKEPSFTAQVFLFSLHLSAFALCVFPFWYRALMPKTKSLSLGTYDAH